MRGIAAECGNDLATWAMHMVTGEDASLFVATTAGFVRRAFPTQWRAELLEARSVTMPR